VQPTTWDVRPGTGLGPSFAPTGGASEGRLLHRWFIRYNPLYFASALFVLAGVFLAATGLRHDDLRSHAALAGITELYQFALLGAAWMLLRWTKQKRPAVILGIVSLVFLFDLTLCSERLASLGSKSIWISAAVGALAVTKLKLIEKIFRLRTIAGAFTVAAAVLAALPLMPHAIEKFAGHDLIRAPLHLAFAGSGAALLAWALLRGRAPFWSDLIADDWGVTVMSRIESVVPWLVTGFFLVHAVAWSVYLSVPLTPAHAAPYLLAAGAALAARLARIDRPVIAELCAGAAAGGACLFAGTGSTGAVMALLAAAALFALVRLYGLRLLLPAMLCAFTAGVLVTTVTPTAPGLIVFALALLGAALWKRHIECLVASAAAITLAVLPIDPPLAGLAFGVWFGPWSWLLFPAHRRWMPIATLAMLEAGGALNFSTDIVIWYAVVAAIPIALALAWRRRDWLAAGLAGAAVLGWHLRDDWTPRSVAGWGVILLVAGFFALAGGFAVNLSTGRRAEVHS